MKIVIDTAAQTLTEQRGSGETTIGLFTKEAFEALSREWLRVGWSLKHYHTFTWFGLPVLQFPEDLLRLQEVIYAIRPQVIVETGIFLGGSLLFHASLLEAMGGGRVIGIDREIQPYIREALSSHPLAPRISLLEGSSIDPAVVSQVRSLTENAGTVLVILDSDHTRQHVEQELESYGPMVTKGSYIVATDGIMKDLYDVPRAQAAWKTDNPFEAVNAFAARHPEFRQQQPRWLSHDSSLTENVTYWPGAWLERIS
jgi:cephalosporin hydroxylase